MEAGEHRVPGSDAMQLVRAHISKLDADARVAHVDAGAVETDAHARSIGIELAVIEGREHHVIHRRFPRGAAGHRGRDQRAHEEARQGRVAIGEMIDVGLGPLRAHLRGQPEPAKSGIVEGAQVLGGDRVAADREEIERAALEAVRHLLAAAADLDEIVAIAGLFQERDLLLAALAGKRVLALAVEPEHLRLALIRDREIRDEGVERPAVELRAGEIVVDHAHGIAAHQRVAAERLAREEQPARQAE